MTTKQLLTKIARRMKRDARAIIEDVDRGRITGENAGALRDVMETALGVAVDALRQSHGT